MTIEIIKIDGNPWLEALYNGVIYETIVSTEEKEQEKKILQEYGMCNEN